MATQFRSEARLVLSFPTPYELKYGIPLATGSYCWWPIAPALAAVALVRALAGRARGVAFMLAVSTLCLCGFYSLVVFGRYFDDGLGPRYELPVVVGAGAGTGACLAPLVARLFERVRGFDWACFRRLRDYGPGIVALLAAAYGIVAIAPRTYPVAFQEFQEGTAPYRAARDKHLKNALVMIYPEDAVQGYWNLNQNAPMDPNPDVLYLARFLPEQDQCAAKNFPGRTWYRAHANGTITPLTAPRR